MKYIKNTKYHIADYLSSRRLYLLIFLRRAVLMLLILTVFFIIYDYFAVI